MIEMTGRLMEWAIPAVLLLVPLYALLKGVDVYAVFCAGAAEGIALLVKLLPFMLGMMVAIEVFRAGGALDALLGLLAVPAGWLGIPAELLPLAVLRSMSGSGALAMTADVLQANGADSFIGRAAAAMQGSSDTTLYVLAVYFGAAGVRRGRHALAVGLLADAVAFAAAFGLTRMFFG